MTTPLLSTRHLTVAFGGAGGLFRAGGTVRAVTDVSFALYPGEALALVGASGFSYPEAAVIAGCPTGTVKSRVFRAREVLQHALDGTRPPVSANRAVRPVVATANLS